MAEQTLEVRAVSGLTNVTMFVKNIDTVEDIATGAVAGAVVAGSTVYRYTFEDLVAATRLVGLRDGSDVIVDTLITIGATTGTYRATSNVELKTDIAAVQADTETLLGRVTTTLFTGITSLASWLGVLAGKTADTTTRAEINDTTAGANFNETTDSLEALRDRGDIAWTTGAGGGGGSTTISPEDIDAIVEGVTAVAPRIKDGLQGQYRLIQGDTWSQVFSIASAGADRVVISVKRQAADTDSESVLLVDSDTGILVLNGANSGFTAGDGSVAFDASTVTLTVESNVTIDIPPDTYFVTVKKLDVGSDRTYELRGRLSVPAAGITATS